MNPAWIPALCAVLGLFGNAVWTALNVAMREDLRKQIAELKDWMATEYITREVLDLRLAALRFGREDTAGKTA